MNYLPSLDVLNDVPGGDVFISHSKFLAFRAVSQTNINFFQRNSDNINKLCSKQKDENQDTKMFCKDTPDLIKLLNLATNESNPKLEDYIRIRNTLITLFYLNLLKTAGYFHDYGSTAQTTYQYSGFSQAELLVGSTIEKLLLVVKFNTHEMGQVERLDIFPAGCKVVFL